MLIKIGPLLSQRQVNNLLHGEKVMIIWSGGNGPHEYTVDRSTSYQIPFAKECNHPIDFVGKESFHTHVQRILKVKNKIGENQYLKN